MRENKVKSALKRGETVFGTMVQEMRSPGIAQILALAGFDFFFIDMEHSPYNLETVADIIRVARLSDIAPFIRVPDLEYFLLSRPLDAGAMGLMTPRVDTPDQVRKVVSFMKYPPMGERGCAVQRAHSDYLSVPTKEFIEAMNRETLVIIQIESKEAIDHIEEMVSVPGVDVALIGPNDLSISLGIPGEPSNPLEVESIEKVIAACNKYGVAAGIHTGGLDDLKSWMQKGMRFITWSGDIGMIMNASRNALQTLRGALKA
jgi:2-keto-3-deoxy-L-rhamnonate aldolase RhmA